MTRTIEEPDTCPGLLEYVPSASDGTYPPTRFDAGRLGPYADGEGTEVWHAVCARCGGVQKTDGVQRICGVRLK